MRVPVHTDEANVRTGPTSTRIRLTANIYPVSGHRRAVLTCVREDLQQPCPHEAFSIDFLAP